MIILDTHALIWSVDDNARLGRNTRALLEESLEKDGVLISAITPWEIALLTEKGRLLLGREVSAWLNAVLSLPNVQLAPIEPQIAVDSVRLPGDFHADPADRIIVATARHFDITLISADQAILSYATKGYVHAVDAAK
ncbi:MAG: type II toxin-antitoxin system VapC family toxin [Gammaproteobacteria bacterium]|nr:type II toxin-antitoxin system VapC family toxin [Gammaproteobacteria bacterium]MCY4281802.1 type II toxin-antitoxin system VapC family toxin [Gammaproteobacteria bacterium]